MLNQRDDDIARFLNKSACTAWLLYKETLSHKALDAESLRQPCSAVL